MFFSSRIIKRTHRANPVERKDNQVVNHPFQAQKKWMNHNYQAKGIPHSPTMHLHSKIIVKSNFFAPGRSPHITPEVAASEDSGSQLHFAIDLAALCDFPCCAGLAKHTHTPIKTVDAKTKIDVLYVCYAYLGYITSTYIVYMSSHRRASRDMTWHCSESHHMTSRSHPIESRPIQSISIHVYITCRKHAQETLTLIPTSTPTRTFRGISCPGNRLHCWSVTGFINQQTWRYDSWIIMSNGS